MYHQLLLLLWQLCCSQDRIIGEIFHFLLWSSTSKQILKLKEVIGSAEVEHLLTVMNFYIRDVKETVLTMKDTHSFLLLRKVISKQYFKRTLSTSGFKKTWIEFSLLSQQCLSGGRCCHRKCQSYFPLSLSLQCLFNSNWNLILLFAHHFPWLIIPRLNSIWVFNNILW